MIVCFIIKNGSCVTVCRHYDQALEDKEWTGGTIAQPVSKDCSEHRSHKRNARVAHFGSGTRMQGRMGDRRAVCFQFPLSRNTRNPKTRKNARIRHPLHQGTFENVVGTLDTRSPRDGIPRACGETFPPVIKGENMRHFVIQVSLRPTTATTDENNSHSSSSGLTSSPSHTHRHTHSQQRHADLSVAHTSSCRSSESILFHTHTPRISISSVVKTHLNSKVQQEKSSDQSQASANFLFSR